MITIQGNNFTEVYYKLLNEGVANKNEISNSRNGKVKDLGPAYFEISNEDTFRFPLLEKRILNPFFALTEFSWIISGSNLLEPLNHFITNYDQYSDNGETLNGAYGYRLRSHHGVDQVTEAINILKTDKYTRRVVLSMWHVNDLGSQSKDIPCNISIMLKKRSTFLDMTIINRSNDLYLGVPYNVVVFYLLQCYIAEKIGCEIGYQRHFTDSLHLYSRNISNVEKIIKYNCLSEINSIGTKIAEFDLRSYVNVNHQDIVERQYKNIDTTYKGFFRAFESYKKNADYNECIRFLPKNQLGYIGYLWFKQKSDFKCKKNYFS